MAACSSGRPTWTWSADSGVRRSRPRISSATRSYLLAGTRSASPMPPVGWRPHPRSTAPAADAFARSEASASVASATDAAGCERSSICAAYASWPAALESTSIAPSTAPATGASRRVSGSTSRSSSSIPTVYCEVNEKPLIAPPAPTRPRSCRGRGPRRGRSRTRLSRCRRRRRRPPRRRSRPWRRRPRGAPRASS